MARTLLIVLLSLGAISGFALGFSHLHHFRHYGYGPGWGRDTYEEHIADLCVRAAERTLHDRPGGTPSPAP